MTLRNKKVLWKAADGREYYVDTSNCDTMEDVYLEIGKMRIKYNTPEPTLMSCNVLNPALLKEASKNTTHIDELPEEFRKDFIEAHQAALEIPPPNKLN